MHSYDIEQQMCDTLSKEISKEVDMDLVHMIIKDFRPEWIEITDVAYTNEMEEWTKANLGNKCVYTGRAWLIKDKASAEIFILKYA
jgi:hypothetical protein